MKLIHCADLHLDSPMESNLPPDKARERKAELFSTFSRLVRLASDGGVSAILISGDLFDSNHITARTQKNVLDLIRSHPELYFFYLCGNHDKGDQWKVMENKPENLCLFDDGWVQYRFGGVTIVGSERPDADTLSLDPKAVNIVMLHGQERSGKGTEKADVIRFANYRDKNIDYMALGHIHEYRAVRIGPRMTACYSGCLEGRGFDECGQKGYVLLELDPKGRLTHRFVPLSNRCLHEVSCDVTGFTSETDLEMRIRRAVEGIPAKDLVKVTLTGMCAADGLIDVSHLQAALGGDFYFLKIKNETRILIRPEDYANDISLRGEFVRRVLASDLKEQEKERVIACGLRALSGEEPIL